MLYSWYQPWLSSNLCLRLQKQYEQEYLQQHIQLGKALPIRQRGIFDTNGESSMVYSTKPIWQLLLYPIQKNKVPIRQEGQECQSQYKKTQRNYTKLKNKNYLDTLHLQLDLESVNTSSSATASVPVIAQMAAVVQTPVALRPLERYLDQAWQNVTNKQGKHSMVFLMTMILKEKFPSGYALFEDKRQIRIKYSRRFGSSPDYDHVQIDESKFGKRKHYRGHPVSDVWVFGTISLYQTAYAIAGYQDQRVQIW